MLAQGKDNDIEDGIFRYDGGFLRRKITYRGLRRIGLGIEMLQRFRTMGLLRDYPLSEIDDKSNASGIADDCMFANRLGFPEMYRKIKNWFKYYVT